MERPVPATADPAVARSGVAYAAAAYLFWGMVPLFFKLLGHVPPATVLAHRIAWSMLVLAALLQVTGGWNEVAAISRNRRGLLILLGATLMLATNWFVFIWAIANHMALQASLGYFINPLVNVAFGAVFLRERFRKAQLVGIVLAAAGVVMLTIARGGLPWAALLLAVSWGIYGLLRKQVPGIGPVAGLSIETAMLAPAAAAYLLWLGRSAGEGVRLGLNATTALLAASGVITVIPLLWFGAAARRLRLSTLGILQYLGPTTQFIIAVMVFREPFRREDLPGFVLIWLACLVYAADSVAAIRRSRTDTPQPTAASLSD